MKTLWLCGCLCLASLPAAGQARCDELLDAGTPEPARLVEPGAPLVDHAYLLTPAKMCEVGQRIAACEAERAVYRAEPSRPWWVPVVVVAGTALLAGLGGYCLGSSTHCGLRP